MLFVFTQKKEHMLKVTPHSKSVQMGSNTKEF